MLWAYINCAIYAYLYTTVYIGRLYVAIFLTSQSFFLLFLQLLLYIHSLYNPIGLMALRSQWMYGQRIYIFVIAFLCTFPIFGRVLVLILCLFHQNDTLLYIIVFVLYLRNSFDIMDSVTMMLFWLQYNISQPSWMDLDKVIYRYLTSFKQTDLYFLHALLMYDMLYLYCYVELLKSFVSVCNTSVFGHPISF